jgi:lysophospholipid acyltransferase (LPLAT)-like uncharacterized protein
MGWLGSRTFREFRNRALCGLTACGVKALLATIRFEVEGAEAFLAAGRNGPGVFVALWHDSLMLPLGHRSRRHTHALMSLGRDGEFAARVLQRFGITAVRGSTSKAATGALHRIVRKAGPGQVFSVTPDGPRGPRHEFQAGIAWLARKTNLPVIALGAAAKRGWQLRSWDRFTIPKPFTKIALVFGPPIVVDPGESLDETRKRLALELARVTNRARACLGLAPDAPADRSTLPPSSRPTA